MPDKEVHVGDDWYLDENNNGDLIVVNSNTGKVVKAIDKETGDEDKKGNSLNNLSSLQGNYITKVRTSYGQSFDATRDGIQAAIDNGSEDDIILIPPGTISVDQTITIDKRMKLAGHFFKGTHLEATSGLDGNILSVDYSGPCMCIACIALIGTGAGNNDVGISISTLQSAVRLSFVSFYNIGKGIEINSSIDRVKAHRLDITDCSTGIDQIGTNSAIWLSQCNIETRGGTGIKLVNNFNSTFMNQIVNCRFMKNHNDIIAEGVSRGAIINSNAFMGPQDPGYASILLDEDASTNVSLVFLIEGNAFPNLGPSEYDYAVKELNEANRNIITGNHVHPNHTTNGTPYYADGTSGTDSIIENNQRRDTYIKSYLASSKTGLASGVNHEIVDTEETDRRDEQDASWNINVDMSGKYRVFIDVNIYNATDADIIDLKVYDDDGAISVEERRFVVEGTDASWSTTLDVNLTAGTNYKIYIYNNNSSFDLSGTNKRCQYRIEKM